MGNCAGSKQPRKSNLPKNKSVILNKQDIITMDMGQDLKFKIVIENIKIKNLPVQNSSIHIQIGDQISQSFPEIKNEINPHWKIKEEFIVKMTSENFKVQQFVLTVKNKNQDIDQVSIDLLKIATGPVHHDFLLHTQEVDTDGSRITFSLTMAQAIIMELKPKDVNVELNDEGLKYERLKTPMPLAYNFNFKVKAHDCDYESDHSYNFRSKHPLKHGFETAPKSSQNLHEDQDMFFKFNPDKENKMSSINQHHNIQPHFSLKQTNTLEMQVQDQDQFFKNQDGEPQNLDLDKSNLSDDEFNVNGMSEAVKLKNLTMNRQTGTINKVKDTLKAIQHSKEEKGKLYRFNSRRHQSFQNEKDILNSKIASNQHLNENELVLQKHNSNYGIQKLPSNIKVKSRASSIHKIQSFLTQKQQTLQYANNHSSITRQLSSGILTAYDDVLDWFRIQNWEFNNKNEDAPQLKVSIYADEFASSTFYIKIWSNYDNNLDPFKSPIGKFDGQIKSHHNFEQALKYNQNNQIENTQNNNNNGQSLNSQPKQSIIKLKSMNINKKDSRFQSNHLELKNANNQNGEQSNQYQFDEESSDSGNSENYIDHDLVAHAEISMNRFCSEDYEIIIQNYEQKLMVQVHHLKDLQLWHHGKCVGTCTGNFVTSHKPFYRQMYGGVRTEVGIAKSTQIYLKKKHLDGKDTKIPIEFKQILNKHDVIEDTMEKLNTEDMPYRQRLRLNKDIQNNLNKINELLKIHQFLDTDQLFKNEEQLLNAQQILIKIAKHLLEYAEQVDEVLRDVYYDVLTRIVNREELRLSHMGFDVDMHGVDLKKVKNKANIEKKISIGLTYQSFLYSTLEKVLIKLEQPGLNEKEREFVENFTSLAYFRIPQFREHLLEAISSKNKSSDMQLLEWVDIDEEQQKQDIKYKFFVSMFTWEKDFYHFLETSPRYVDHINRLNAILEKDRWQQRFQKTGVAFFMFLASWSNYVQKNIKSAQSKQNMPWEVLPGYNTLMKSFLFEMKYRDSEQFPDSLKEASLQLLNNPNHLKPFLYIMYNKTNVYISRQVFYCYDVMNIWFQRLLQTNQKIPTNFDFNFLFKGVRTILDFEKCEHAVTIAKVMLFIYHNYTLFPLDKKLNEISKIIFSNKTFYYFAHWSKTVRNAFQSILMYRIYHQHRHISLGDDKFDDYKQEKMHLQLQLQKNKQDIKEQEYQNNEIFSSFIKMVRFAKKSKRKIQTYQQSQEVPIQKQLAEKSLRVKLLQLRKRLQRHKNQLQNRKESELSGHTDMSTPTSKSKKLLNGSDQHISHTPQMQPINQSKENRPKYGSQNVPLSQQSSTINSNNQTSKFKLESLPDSSFVSLQLDDRIEQDDIDDVQSMCMIQKKNYQDISDMSQQNIRRASFSEMSSSYSDEENFEQLGRMEEDLKEEFGIQNIKKKQNDKPKNITNIQQNQNQFYNHFSPVITAKKGPDSIEEPIYQIQSSMSRKYSYENSIKPKHKRKQMQGTNKKKIQTQKGQKKKVYQGKFQQDQQQRLFMVPKKCYKLLVIAYEEFEEIQKEYLEWYKKQQQIVNNDVKLSEQEKIEKLREAPIPDIPIKIQKDEAESKGLHQADEW